MDRADLEAVSANHVCTKVPVTAFWWQTSQTQAVLSSVVPSACMVHTDPLSLPFCAHQPNRRRNTLSTSPQDISPAKAPLPLQRRVGLDDL